MTGPFSVAVEAQGALQSVAVDGELDQSTAPELRAALTETLDSRGAVLVDLGGCRFIDSTGLSLLVETKRHLAEDGRRFAVCCADPDVARLLELTGIDRAVGLFATRDEAHAALLEA